jgi:FdrA protein
MPPELLQSLEAARTSLQPGQRTLRALYCGGTLAYEALWLLRNSLENVVSNLDDTLGNSQGSEHVILDLGAEEFTSGRPHPMIDPSVRSRQLLDMARRPEVAVVLCDVMLGWGAHPDPAHVLTQAWEEAQNIANADGRNLIGIASVCGTLDDPQGYEEQCRKLRDHGFILAESNAQAVRLAASVIGPREKSVEVKPSKVNMDPVPLDPPIAETVPKIPSRLTELFAAGPRVINIGLELFAEQMLACGVPVVQVDWRPPAGGNEHLASLLERLR